MDKLTGFGNNSPDNYKCTSEIKFEWKTHKTIFTQQFMRYLSISLNLIWFRTVKHQAKIIRKWIDTNFKLLWFNMTYCWPIDGINMIHTLLFHFYHIFVKSKFYIWLELIWLRGGCVLCRGCIIGISPYILKDIFAGKWPRAQWIECLGLIRF